MQTNITLTGEIKFEPENRTKKHHKQANWKKIAMVHFYGDVCEYYAWFIKKRFNLTLNKPLRNAHISFINDSINDIITGNGFKNVYEANNLWSVVKNKWEGKKVPIILDLNPYVSKEYWCLNVNNESNVYLQEIRNELKLGKPFFDLHMTIGRAEHLQLEHSNYIAGLIKKNT